MTAGGFEDTVFFLSPKLGERKISAILQSGSK